MGAVDARGIRQAGQPVQRVVHLRGAAFEETAAAGGEQGVATEQHGRTPGFAVIGDVAQGMPRNMQHAPGSAEDLQRVAFADGQVAGRDVFLSRADHPRSAVLLETRHAADMVVVMVGDQDVGQAPVGVRRQPAEHRLGGAGVHHGALACRRVLQQPDVVVIEGRQGIDRQHGGILALRNIKVHLNRHCRGRSSRPALIRRWS